MNEEKKGRPCNRCGKWLKNDEVCHCIEDEMKIKFSYENMCKNQRKEQPKYKKSQNYNSTIEVQKLMYL